MSLMSVAYYDAHFDADSIKIARGLAAEQQIANVRFEVADLYALPFQTPRLMSLKLLISKQLWFRVVC